MTLIEFAEAAATGEDNAMRLLRQAPGLARERLSAPELFLAGIRHHLYRGDSALHVAAAAHRPATAGLLIELGADVEAANRRGARPLHYAADGIPGWEGWRAHDQAAAVRRLLEAGADPNAGDSGGVTPLHRAVRNRCSAAAAALLEHGANPTLKTRKGSTARDLTAWSTGRGGAGSPAAKAELQEILRLLG